MAKMICTHCLYEGKAVNPPSDEAGGGDPEIKKAFDRLCRIVFMLTFIPVKPLAYLLAAPFYLVWWPLRGLFKISTKKHCPNCGLPLMVNLKSDRGEIARRKLELQLGGSFKKEEAPKVAFGREMALPEDKKAADDAFDHFEPPERKISLYAEPEPEPEAVPEKSPAAQQESPKKPADPDAW